MTEDNVNVTSIIIGGIRYVPECKDEKEEDIVDYRTMVNNKLKDFGTFYEWQEKEIELGDEDSLCLSCGLYGNALGFIIAGRVQDVLAIDGLAFYAGDNKQPLYLTLNEGATWKLAYGLLLKHEHFIIMGALY